MKRIADYFDCAFLINLDRSTDRLDMMTRRFKKVGIPFERFPAIDRITLTDIPEGMNAGHCACARSHAAVYHLMKDRGYESALIFEDDAVLRDDTVSMLEEKLVPQLKGLEWDMFFLGAKAGMKCCSGAIIAHPSENLYQFRSGWHAHAYAVHRRAYDRVIAWTESSLWHKGGWFDGFSDATLKKFLAAPMLAVQNTGPSQIDLKWSMMNRLKEYWKATDRDEFVAHCEELRDSEQ
jgi:GR25 family glycosyltransferase involved in LPS biosynthesis